MPEIYLYYMISKCTEIWSSCERTTSGRGMAKL